MSLLKSIIRSLGIFLLGDPTDLTDEHRRAQYTLGDWRIGQ